MISVVPWVQPNGGLWMDISWANFPAYAEEELPGLDGNIYIARDNWGVPHIFATSTKDLYLACGYVHAQDRLFQMDLYRRLVQGRLAEIFGSSYLDMDIFYRNLNLENIANESYNLLPLDVKELLQSYAKGVNLYIDTIGSKVPMEMRVLGYFPDSWTANDTLCVERFLAWTFSSVNTFLDLEMAGLIEALGETTVWNELFPDTHYNDLPITPSPTSKTEATDLYADDSLLEAAYSLATHFAQLSEMSPVPQISGGSNSWVVNGSRTSSGAPILCSDPHLTLSLPAFWYEIHLVGPTDDIQGITLPGFPFIMIGHNSDIAWGFTTMQSDISDFYFYEWIQNNPNQYWWDDSWNSITEQVTTIYTKDSGAISKKSVILNSTIHGPLFEEPQGCFALKWTGQNSSQSAAAYLRISQANNYTAFCNALELLQSPDLNFIYSDTNGNIAYHATSAHPIRNAGDGPSILNGSSGTHEWLGFIPFSELPHSLNPSTGYLVAANNIPANSSYPYYLGYNFAPSHRAQRITQLLNSSSSHSVSDMKKIQLDTYSLHATAIKDIVADTILSKVSETEEPIAYAAATYLKNWNCKMTTDSIGATIWTSFFPIFFNNTFFDEYDKAGIPDGPYPAATVLENFTITNDSHWFNNTKQSGTQTRDDIILASFREAVDILSNSLGANTELWQYSQIHIIEIQHTLSSTFPYLDAPLLPINGSIYTVNYAPGYLVNVGASCRVIIDLDNFDLSVGVLPGGQRSNPYSTHYLDQFALWVNGDFHPLSYPHTLEEMTEYESLLVLIPSSS
jgi:penicillin amidase